MVCQTWFKPKRHIFRLQDSPSCDVIGIHVHSGQLEQQPGRSQAEVQVRSSAEVKIVDRHSNSSHNVITTKRHTMSSQQSVTQCHHNKASHNVITQKRHTMSSRQGVTPTRHKWNNLNVEWARTAVALRNCNKRVILFCKYKKFTTPGIRQTSDRTSQCLQFSHKTFAN